jgi:hypothetical protein
MPHSQLSTRNDRGERSCPYCGHAIRGPRPEVTTCVYCRDLPALEAFDDRYLFDFRLIQHGYTDRCTLTEPE